MRDPNNLIQVTSNLGEYNVIQIGELPEFDKEDYDLLDNSGFKNYMNDLKRMIRNSPEYKWMVQFMRENMDMHECAFYENINNIETSKIKIHLHHDPLCLYDICLVVFNKRVAYQEPLYIELVAKEVMMLHYMLMVGLIPLSETVHQLVHNGFLFVPTDKVLGDYKAFINLYGEFLTPEQHDILQRIENLTLTVHLNTDVLKKSFSYIDATGAYALPRLDDIKQLLTDGQDIPAPTYATEYDSNSYIVPAMIRPATIEPRY